MPVETSPPGRTATKRPGTTTARTSSRSGQGTAARAAGQTRRVASTSADEGRQVASRAAGETQRVAGRAKDQGQAVARTAKDQGSAVARLAAEGARDVTGTVRSQAMQVRDELATQGRTVVEETRNKLQEQTQAQARRAGDGIARLASEAQALAAGRPEEAETIRDYVAQSADRLLEVADRLYGLADDVESRGIDGVLSDLQRFARRRPGVFLVGAAVAGFGVGRAVRSAQGDDNDNEDEDWDDGDTGYESPAVGARGRAVARTSPAGRSSRAALPAARGAR